MSCKWCWHRTGVQVQVSRRDGTKFGPWSVDKIWTQGIKRRVFIYKEVCKWRQGSNKGLSIMEGRTVCLSRDWERALVSSFRSTAIRSQRFRLLSWGLEPDWTGSGESAYASDKGRTMSVTVLQEGRPAMVGAIDQLQGNWRQRYQLAVSLAQVSGQEKRGWGSQNEFCALAPHFPLWHWAVETTNRNVPSSLPSKASWTNLLHEVFSVFLVWQEYFPPLTSSGALTTVLFTGPENFCAGIYSWNRLGMPTVCQSLC